MQYTVLLDCGINFLIIPTHMLPLLLTPCGLSHYFTIWHIFCFDSNTDKIGGNCCGLWREKHYKRLTTQSDSSTIIMQKVMCYSSYGVAITIIWFSWKLLPCSHYIYAFVTSRNRCDNSIYIVLLIRETCSCRLPSYSLVLFFQTFQLDWPETEPFQFREHQLWNSVPKCIYQSVSVRVWSNAKWSQ